MERIDFILKIISNKELSDRKIANFVKIDECLSKEYTIDYWSDDVIISASKLLQDFTSADWDILETVWVNKPTYWQNYLAQILAWGDTGKSVILLLKLITIDNEEIIVSATDSLRGIQENIHPIVISPKIENHLRRIVAQTKSELSARTINAFLHKVKVRES